MQLYSESTPANSGHVIRAPFALFALLALLAPLALLVPLAPLAPLALLVPLALLALACSASSALAVEGSTAAGPIGGTDVRSAFLPPPGVYGGAIGLAGDAPRIVDGRGETALGLKAAYLTVKGGRAVPDLCAGCKGLRGLDRRHRSGALRRVLRSPVRSPALALCLGRRRSLCRSCLVALFRHAARVERARIVSVRSVNVVVGFVKKLD